MIRVNYCHLPKLHNDHKGWPEKEEKSEMKQNVLKTWGLSEKGALYSFSLSFLDDSVEGGPSLKTVGSCAYQPTPRRIESEHWVRRLPLWLNATHITGTQMSTKEDEDRRRKNAKLSGFKSESTDSPYFSVGRFLLKVSVPTLSYKIRRSSKHKALLLAWKFYSQLLSVLLRRFLQFASIPTTP